MKKNVKKVAIITGASRGIGKAIALKLHKKGFIVVLVSHSKENLENALKDFNGKAIAVLADISKEKEVIAMTQKVVRQFGRIDVFVNSAGWSAMGDIARIKKRDFEQTVAVNLMGVFYCMRECVKQMEKQPKGGQIININSIAVKTPSLFSSRSPHCATKAAVAALSASVQAELGIARKNIKIANIYSGPVLTEGFIKVLQRIQDDNRKIEEFTKDILKPEDIAYAVWAIINQGKNSNITEIVIQPSFYVPRGVARKLR